MKTRLFNEYTEVKELKDKIETSKKGVTIVLENSANNSWEVSSDEDNNIQPPTEEEQKDPDWREKRRKNRLKVNLMRRIRKAIKKRVD